MFDSEEWNVDDVAIKLNSSLFEPVQKSAHKKKTKKKSVTKNVDVRLAEVNNDGPTPTPQTFEKKKTKKKKDKNLKDPKTLQKDSKVISNEGLKSAKHDRKLEKTSKQRPVLESRRNGAKKAKSSKRKAATVRNEECVKNRDIVQETVDGKDVKRKRKSDVQDCDCELPTKVKKDNLDTSSISTMTRKERRNKRKKKNSKKNKFKHMVGTGQTLDQGAPNTPEEVPEIDHENDHLADSEKLCSQDFVKVAKLHQSKSKMKQNKNNIDACFDKGLVKKLNNIKTGKQQKTSERVEKHVADNHMETSPKREHGFNIEKLQACLTSQETLIKSLNSKLKKEISKGKQKNVNKNEKRNSEGDNNSGKSRKKRSFEGQMEHEDEHMKSLKERMSEQLNAARFRYLNEQLYTTSGKDAARLFVDDENAFHVYHKGYDSQVKKWPVDPLDVIMKQIRCMHKYEKKVIADMGCGSARLAQSLATNTVHSFDLVALTEHVIACEMSKVPLDNSSVDVVVFCLSLMGTNLVDYFTEANRILKTGGLMKIAEIESRFQKIGAFVSCVEKMGFEVIVKDTSKKMFYLFDFKKVKNVKKSEVGLKIELEPCIYKKR